MSGYTKLFNSILASTVWSEPNEVRIVWITMLAMADKRGVVEGSTPGLAVFARLSLDATETALDRLAAPDVHSRSKEHEGRRIEVTDGGWRIINHNKYREKMSADERREYLRVKQQEQRDKNKQRQQVVNTCSDLSTESTHTAPAPAPAPDPKTSTNNKLISKPEIVPPAPRKSSSLAPSNGNGHKNTNVVIDEALDRRVEAFVYRYPAIYAKARKGARYLVKEARDFGAFVQLVNGYGAPPNDARLDMMLEVFLKMPAKVGNNIPGTPNQFLNMAPECDRLLRENGR